MDLNVPPQPEEDEHYFELEEEKSGQEEEEEEEEEEGEQKQEQEAVAAAAEEDKAPQRVVHAQHIESGAEIARREREERRLRLKRERIDDRPSHSPQQAINDNAYQKNFRSYDQSKLPPGWLDCPPLGQEIYGIIPSKVPLGESYANCIPPGRRYSFKQVFNKVRVLGKRIGLVIDLTNTSRYYPVSDWKVDGIKHIKIQCRGRGSVPDNESVNSFVYEASRFLSRQKPQQMKQVFVHCTHGHNRTGFMIVHYLVRMLSFSVTQAVQKFAEVRPPGIYKPNYIDSLYTFYHENRPERVICPQTPEWKRSTDLDLNGDAVPDDDDDGDTTAPVQESHEISTVMTNDDVLGDSIPYDQQDAMRHFCYQALKLTTGPKGNSQFPGSHPVSLNRENLQLLRQRYYYATWKADGTRYMMLITVDGCYLIDRNFNFRRVQMRFLCRITKDAEGGKTHHYTLLDGEMIIDTVPDSRKQERRYLIYDMMALNSRSVVELPFSERSKMLEREIVEPRNQERHYICKSRHPHNDCYYRYDLEPFRVRRKDFWPLSTVNKILREFIPKLSHEADGLIFQGWDDPYVPRTHEGLLKWKYANMNSVDFLFEVNDDRQLLFCFERGRKKLIEGKVQFNDDSDPASYAGKIIECSWDSDENEWVFMRIRTDKATPNDFNTYKKVLWSIRDNITEDVLMAEIKEILELPMYVERLKQLANKANAPRRHQ